MTTIEKLYPAIRGHRITTDSPRQIIRGDIFIALKGENFDGNRYAAAALEQGAALAIIDNADYLSPDCELVADSLLSCNNWLIITDNNCTFRFWVLRVPTVRDHN